MKSYVLLKDGTMLEMTPKQSQSLGMAIMTCKKLDSTKIKLAGRVFKLTEIETDPDKIFKANQTKIDI